MLKRGAKGFQPFNLKSGHSEIHVLIFISIRALYCNMYYFTYHYMGIAAGRQLPVYLPMTGIPDLFIWSIRCRYRRPSLYKETRFDVTLIVIVLPKGCNHCVTKAFDGMCFID